VTGATTEIDIALGEVGNRELAEGETAQIYFMRHGEDWINKLKAKLTDEKGVFKAKHEIKDAVEHDQKDWDVTLDSKGFNQSVAARHIMTHHLGLDKVPPDTVQLAASMNSRAFDSTVSATQPLWQKWVDDNVEFMLHAVPAAMELDTMKPSQRRSGLADDDPVRWEDSVIGRNDDGTLSGASDLFYQKASDAMHMEQQTSQPVQVQSYYNREYTDFYVEGCTSSQSRKQTTTLARYLAAQAQAGKKHIVVGTHSSVIACMLKRFGNGNKVLKMLQHNGKHKVYTEADLAADPDCKPPKAMCFPPVGNGAVLHTKMFKRSNDEIGLDVIKLFTGDALGASNEP
jgi:hypothetical protein